MNRRIFLRSLAGLTVAGGAAATGFAWTEDTHHLEVSRIPVRFGLQKPLRVAALGDIHFDPLYQEAYLARVIERVNDLQPDIIVYTGDFITGRIDRINDLADILARGRARLGSYAIAGNHDEWFGIDAIVRALQQRAGIHFLRNESVAVPDEDQLYLTGLDSFWAGRPDPSIIAKSPAASRNIVLAHEPDSFLSLVDPRIRLQISGHTHGGQVRLPVVGALVLPKYGKDFQAGLYTRDQRQLYVNRGIGSLLPHVRLNCRPEITCFELS